MPTTIAVTVLTEDKASHDLTLPGDMPVAAVIEDVAGHLGLGSAAKLMLSTGRGQQLDPQRTLQQQNVVDGTYLLLKTRSKESRRRAPEACISPIATTGYRVMPCYLVVDTSTSMEGAPLRQINAELPKLQAKMRDEPVLAEVAQIAIVSFDRTARTVRGLTDIQDVNRMPTLEAGARRTDYTSAFEHLLSAIRDDMYRLYTEGRNPYRPAVFFLSDGAHNGARDWNSAHAQLVNRRDFWAAPNIIAFGFGNVVEDVLKVIGTRAAYIADTDGGPSAQLDKFMVFLLSSLTMSMRGVGQKDDYDILRVPPKAPAGWRSILIG